MVPVSAANAAEPMAELDEIEPDLIEQREILQLRAVVAEHRNNLPHPESGIFRQLDAIAKNLLDH